VKEAPVTIDRRRYGQGSRIAEVHRSWSEIGADKRAWSEVSVPVDSVVIALLHPAGVRKELR